MKASDFRLLFFGSDKFSSIVLKHLVEKKLCRLEVVTKPGSLLDQYSASCNLRRYPWPIGTDIWTRSRLNIGLVASFGHLIDEQTINRFHYGLFNVHPSLLPKYRGSTPVQAAILDGLSVTGCTIMRIPAIPKFDIGDIVLQEQLDINHREYAVDLRDRLAHLGASMAERLLVEYEDCMKRVEPQGDLERSYARKIKPEQGLIKFKSEGRDLIDRKIRAYTGYIDLYTVCSNGLKVRLENMIDPQKVECLDIDRLAQGLIDSKRSDSNDNTLLQPGLIYMHKTRRLLCFRCQDGKWLAFGNVTPEFKPKMTAVDFYNGYVSKVDFPSLTTDV